MAGGHPGRAGRTGDDVVHAGRDTDHLGADRARLVPIEKRLAHEQLTRARLDIDVVHRRAHRRGARAARRRVGAVQDLQRGRERRLGVDGNGLLAGIAECQRHGRRLPRLQDRGFDHERRVDRREGRIGDTFAEHFDFDRGEHLRLGRGLALLVSEGGAGCGGGERRRQPVRRLFADRDRELGVCLDGAGGPSDVGVDDRRADDGSLGPVGRSHPADRRGRGCVRDDPPCLDDPVGGRNSAPDQAPLVEGSGHVEHRHVTVGGDVAAVRDSGDDAGREPRTVGAGEVERVAVDGAFIEGRDLCAVGHVGVDEGIVVHHGDLEGPIGDAQVDTAHGRCGHRQCRRRRPADRRSTARCSTARCRAGGLRTGGPRKDRGKRRREGDDEADPDAGPEPAPDTSAEPRRAAAPRRSGILVSLPRRRQAHLGLPARGPAPVQRRCRPFGGLPTRCAIGTLNTSVQVRRSSRPGRSVRRACWPGRTGGSPRSVGFRAG